MKSSQSLACLFALSLGAASAGLAQDQAAFPPPASPVTATAQGTDPDAKERDYFTDLELVTQDGESVRFFTDVLKDHVVLINFIFTNCGSACPLLTRSLASVADLLGDDVGKSVRFVSISIDPERDDPGAMKAFAEKHGANRPGWLFLTGEKTKIDLIVKKLGQYQPDVEAHSTMVLAGNVPERHWIKIVPNQPPPAIAERMRELMGKGFTAFGG
jgi:cytochrome oxidase Cu insertion factor (SCO1/SenC/PrrC family)